MKTIVLGDIHGRDIWKDIVAQEKADRVIFIGDYFDSFDIEPATQQYNFKEIILVGNNMKIASNKSNSNYKYFENSIEAKKYFENIFIHLGTINPFSITIIYRKIKSRRSRNFK